MGIDQILDGTNANGFGNETTSNPNSVAFQQAVATTLHVDMMKFNLQDGDGAVLKAYNGNGDNGPLYLNVTRVRIEDVRANDGGGFSLNNCVDCAIADTVFKRSIANKNGGAMYLNQYNTNCQFFNVSFEQCSAADNGGG